MTVVDAIDRLTRDFRGRAEKVVAEYPRKSRQKTGPLWPANAFAPAAGLRNSLMWTNWARLTVGLGQRGYAESKPTLLDSLMTVLRVCGLLL